GIRQRLRILLANGSDTPIRGLRVCFQAPVKVIRGRRCTTIRRLPSESSAVVDFPIVLRELVPARRTRVAIRFVARGAGGILADAQRGYRLAPVSSQSASPSM